MDANRTTNKTASQRLLRRLPNSLQLAGPITAGSIVIGSIRFAPDCLSLSCSIDNASVQAERDYHIGLITVSRHLYTIAKGLLRISSLATVMTVSFNFSPMAQGRCENYHVTHTHVNNAEFCKRRLHKSPAPLIRHSRESGNPGVGRPGDCLMQISPLLTRLSRYPKTGYTCAAINAQAG